MGIMKKRRLRRYRNIRSVPHLVFRHVPLDEIVHNPRRRWLRSLETLVEGHRAVRNEKERVGLFFGKDLLEAVKVFLPLPRSGV
jgi:hypothetical protein